MFKPSLALRGAVLFVFVGCASSKKAPTGGISGQVVVAGGSAAGVTLQLAGPASAATVSDDAGAYSFGALPAGNYLVTASQPDTIERSQTREVTVANQVAPSIDFAFSAAGSLAGRATLAGAPTGNAGIFVVAEGSDAVASTDDAGNYLLAGVRAGQATVIASHPGYVSASSAPVAVRQGVRGAVPALALSAAVGDLPDPARSTLTATPAQATADGRQRIALEVHVSDASGAPLAGQVVVLSASDPAVQLSQPAPTSALGTAEGAAVASRAVNATVTAAALGAAGPVTLSQTAAISFVAGPAAALVFSTQPASVTAGASFGVAAQVLDASGNLVDATDVIALSIFTGPAGARLAGTVSQAAVHGTATFAGLSLAQAGRGYTLAAAAAGRALAVSQSFDVAPGAPARLGFLVQPSASTAGAAINSGAAPVAVSLQDSFGNTVPGAPAAQVSLALSGSALNGATPVAQNAGPLGTSDGVATFPSLEVDQAGNSYTLTASADGYPSVTSAAYAVAPAAASALVFVDQPQSASADAEPLPPVTLEVVDAFANLLPPQALTLAINGGASGAVLQGGSLAAGFGNLTAFTDLVLRKAGHAYQLVASLPGVPSATSSAFDITPGAYSKFAFVSQPQDTIAGATLPDVIVGTIDAWGNVVVGPSGSVLFSGLPVGASRISLVGGQADYSNIVLTSAGHYSITAQLSGTVSSTARSNTFTVSAADPAKLVFPDGIDETPAGQPLTSNGGPVRVAVTDQYGNPTTASSGSITVSLGQDSTGDVLQGTLTQPISSGAASFANLKLIKSAGDYVMLADAGGLGEGSAGFAVDPGPATHLAFGVGPSAARASSFFAGTVTVEARDAYENAASSGDSAAQKAIAMLELSVSGGAAGARLIGTTDPRPDPSGAARVSYPGLGVDRAGAGYSISAHSTQGGLAAATSDPFDVTAAAWTACQPIEGGTAPAIVFASGGGTVYAGAGSKIFASADAGQNWTLLGSFGARAVLAIGVDPNAPAKIFAVLELYDNNLGYVHTLVRSLDSGASWSVAPVPLSSSRHQGGFVVAFSGASPSQLYVAIPDSGLLRSTDDGASFTLLFAGDIQSFAADPADPNTLFLADTHGGHLQRSTDGGQTWTPTEFGLAGGPGFTRQIVFDPTLPSTVYLSYNGDLFFVSSNATAANPVLVSWTNANQSVLRLAVSQATPGLVYALTRDGHVAASANRAVTWGAPVALGGAGAFIAVDPVSDAVVASGTGTGIQRSANQGASFAASSTGFDGNVIAAFAQDPSHPSTLYAGTNDSGVFVSNDACAHWAPFSTGLATGVITQLAVAGDGSYVLAASNVFPGGAGALQRRATGDTSWSASLTSGLGRQTIYSLAIDAVTPAQVYFSAFTQLANGYALYGSSSSGGSPAVLKSQSSSSSVIADPVTGGRAIVLGSPVLVTTNSGASFSPTGGTIALFNGLGYLGAISAKDGNAIFASNFSGTVFKSANGGAQFTAMTALPSGVTALVLDPGDAATLLAASGQVNGGYGGVFQSSDGAASWSYAGSGLSATGTVNALVRDPVTAGLYYAASSGGVFVTTSGGQ